MGKLTDIWHQIKITRENFINCFLLSWWDFSSVSGSEHCSLKRAGNGELFLSVLLSCSVCLRTGSFGLGSEYPAPIHDSWLWMRHMLLQVFLERDVSFHLGRRKQPNLCSHQSTAGFFCFSGKSKVFAGSSVSLLALQTFSAFVGPVVSPGSLGAQLARLMWQKQGHVRGRSQSPAMPWLSTESLTWSRLEISFSERCSFNPRLKPDPTWGNFSGRVCNWSCGIRCEGGVWKLDLLPKLESS